jgi:uncharacterized membrane protein HdeD (DUF308 family)
VKGATRVKQDNLHLLKGFQSFYNLHRMTNTLNTADLVDQRGDGPFLPIFAGCAFFWTIAANFLYQFLIYRNLQNQAGLGYLFEQEEIHPYVHKWIITVPSSPSTQSGLTFQMLSGCSATFWSLILAVLSACVSWWISTHRHSSFGKLWVPVFTVMAAAFGWFALVYADRTGGWMAGWVYFCLFVAIQETSSFNPHLDVGDHGDARGKKLEAIHNLYFQYFATSLAVIGTVLPIVFFAVYTTYRSRFSDRPQLLYASEWPYYLSVITYSMVGIIGVLGGITHEFHRKQGEVFRMRWDDVA